MAGEILHVPHFFRKGSRRRWVYHASAGRPSYPPLMMVKALPLDQLYDLLVPQMVEALGSESPSNAS